MSINFCSNSALKLISQHRVPHSFSIPLETGLHSHSFQSTTPPVVWRSPGRLSRIDERIGPSDEFFIWTDHIFQDISRRVSLSMETGTPSSSSPPVQTATTKHHGEEIFWKTLPSSPSFLVYWSSTQDRPPPVVPPCNIWLANPGGRASIPGSLPAWAEMDKNFGSKLRIKSLR